MLTRFVVPSILVALLLAGCPIPGDEKDDEAVPSPVETSPLAIAAGGKNDEVPDETPPDLVAASPVTRVGDVFTLEFNEAIEKPVKSSITVLEGKIELGFSVAVKHSGQSRTLDITLRDPPTVGGIYRIKLERGAVKDKAGNPNGRIVTPRLTVATPALKTPFSLSAEGAGKLIVAFEAPIARTVASRIKVYKNNKSALTAGYTVAINRRGGTKLEINLDPPGEIGDTYRVGLLAGAVFDSGNNGNTEATTSDYTLSYGDVGYKWAKVASDAGIWSIRSGHAGVVFKDPKDEKDKLWVLGGSNRNDVWSSPDGITWTEVTKKAGWPGRSSHASVVFDNRLWVLGGGNHDGFRNDVWSSPDGITWKQAAAVAGTKRWSGRDGHASVVFKDPEDKKDKLWVLGGYDYDDKNDVWSSSDGVTWKQESNAKWSGRSGHASVVFKDKLWVLGGFAGGWGYKNDVWSSPDGVTWKQESNAKWLGRRGAGVVFEDRLWVLGGDSGARTNDVRSSPDGVTWKQESNAKWSGRRGHASVVFDNKLWVLGGFDNRGYKNDVWFFGAPVQ